MGTEAETRLQAEMGTLKRTVCVTEDDCLLWRGRVWSFAGICRFIARGGGRTGFSREADARELYHKNDWLAPTRVGNPLRRLRRHLPRRGRGYLYVGWVTRKVDVKVKGIQCSAQDVPMPGGAGVPREVCKMGDAPARGATRSVAGGAPPPAALRKAGKARGAEG